jgi:hypothetical protein
MYKDNHGPAAAFQRTIGHPTKDQQKDGDDTVLDCQQGVDLGE